jgi:hypothetical protein
MQGEERITVRRRRTGAEVRQLVAEFVDSGMRRSEFCRSRGLGLSTLGRHLRKKKRKSSAAAGLVAVELGMRQSPTEHEPSCGLAVVLVGGRRIEVRRDFDPHTLERLVSVLERV